MSRFLASLLQQAGHEGTAYDHTNVFDLIAVGRRRLTGEHYDPQPVVDLLRSWQHEAEVNPGPCFILPEVLAAWGPELPIIHLVREREACIGSIVKHVKTGPRRWGNFVGCDGPVVVHRPTAVHFGEMSQSEWDDLPLSGRVAWLYDAHHRETTRQLSCFHRSLVVRTEDLNDIATQNRIAGFLDLASPTRQHMPWVGRSMAVSYDAVTETAAETFEVNLQNFDWNRALLDPYYPFLHFFYVEVARYRKDPSDPVRKSNLLAARKWINEIIED